MTDYETREEVDNYFKTYIEQNDKISDHNTQLVKEYYNAQKGTKDRGYTREQWYIGKWRTLLSRFIDRDQKIDEIEEIEWKGIITDIDEDPEKDYADSVVDDFKGAVRDFYKQRYPTEFRRPDRVKAILELDKLEDKKEKNKERKRVENILSPEQVWKMSKAADKPRNACLPILLFEAGCRTEEIVERDIGDIEPHSEYWKVTFHDAKENKEDRELPLTHCIPKLRNWLENHPNGDDSDAPLFVCVGDFGDGERGDRLSGSTINDILKHLGKKADLDLDPDTLTVTDHRKSSATYKGTELGWGIQRLMWWHSWCKPDRAKSYCRDDNKRMCKAILKQNGIEMEEDDQPNPLETTTCQRCEEERSADAKYCPKCSIPLDNQTALKDSALIEAGRKVVDMKLDEKVDDEEIRQVVEKVKRA